MDDDKIKYSDIIQPDDSIEKLVKQLTELNQSYETMVNAIRAGADRIVHSIKGASGATKEGRRAIDEATEAASRLERAQKELSFAMSDTGEKVAWLKARTSDYNKMTVEQQRYIRQAVGSYDRLKSELKQQIALYKSLTAAEREDANMGKQVLDTILGIKNELTKLDATMKPHIQTISELEKAKQRLAKIQAGEYDELIKVQAQIKSELKSRQEQKEKLTELEQAKQRLKFATSSENEQLKLYTTQVREANKIAELNARIANSAEGSYNQLSAQYALNKIRLNQMSAAEREAVDVGQQLEKETNELYQQMIKLQEATGNYRLSVGNYKKAWDGLGVSVTQIVRELPAAAVSLNTFFLGISNNIPMLVDEIQRLKAQGTSTVGVIKQIGKSLLGWNSILVIVLTVLSAFGSQIFKWIDGLLSGKNAVLSVTEAMETLNEELSKNASTYGNEVSILRRLSDEWKRLGSNIKEQQQFIRDNQSEFNKLDVSINDVNTASKVFVDNTDEFIDALKARAKAQAALNILSEQTGKLLEIENKIEVERTKEYSFFENAANYFKAFAAGFSGKDSDLSFATRLATQRQRNINDLKDDKEELQETVDNYFKVYQFYIDKTNEIYDKLGLEEKHKKDRKGPQMRDTEDTLESLSVAATKAYQESVTAIEREEIKKRRKEYLEAYNVEVADLSRKYNKIQRILNGQDSRYKKLTEEQKEQALKAQDDIVKAIENKKEAFSQNWALLTYQKQEQDAQTQLEALNLQINAVKAGSEEELRLRLQILRVEEQIALARNRQLPPAQQQDENVIKAGFKKQRTEVTTGFNDTAFEQSQALEKAKFDSVKHNEQQITRFTLQQEKERWERQIQLAEAGALDWSQAQIDAAKETVKGINAQLKENQSFIARVGERGFKGALFESFGWNEDQIDAMSQATDFIVNQFSEILAAEVALAEKEKELADERVARAQSAYEAEVEARNKGYANNVATAKKELEQEKKNQLQKQKMLEAAQKRQQAVDTIAQTSSLITASALLWKSFAGTGPAAPFLAAAAIAAMWTSFAVAKIKARQVTSAGSEEYGEGGLEFLEGGSHASGNDIDLGVNNKRKRRMRAEGGEALAIINKRRTRQYRKVLPDVIESFNKGTFEDKFLNAFAGADRANISIVSNSSTDLSKLERDVSSIRKQNETKYFTMPDGTVIMQYKNVKRIIKN